MSSITKPREVAFKAGGTIAKGQPVKFGADNQTVVAATAATDRAFGIAQESVGAGEGITIAMNGGGAFGKFTETIAKGNYLVPGATGLVKALAAGNTVVAIAMEDGAAGEIRSVEVVHFLAAAAQA